MKIIASCIGLFWHAMLLGQTSVPNNVRASFTIDQIGGRNGFDPNGIFLYGIPVVPGGYLGDTYLDSAWTAAGIELYKNGTTLKNLSARYDIQRNGLEVKVGREIRFLPGQEIKALSFTNSGEGMNFINAKEFDSNLSFLVQILAEGRATLLKQVQVTIKKSDYNQSLDIGSRYDKIIKNDFFYCWKDGQLTQLPKSQRKLKSKLIDLKILDPTASFRLKDENSITDLFSNYNKD